VNAARGNERHNPLLEDRAASFLPMSLEKVRIRTLERHKGAAPGCAI
jgi:hypothetical protein